MAVIGAVILLQIGKEKKAPASPAQIRRKDPESPT
jgi:hypothetical protein